MAPTDLEVRNSLGGGEVDATGGFELTNLLPTGVPQDVGAPQFAAAIGPDGAPVLLGWLAAEDATLDARSTAVALLWFATGMPYSDPDRRPELYAELRSLAGVDLLETEIASQHAAGAAALDDMAGSLAPIVQGVVDGIVAAAPSFAAARVEPVGSQSGVRLDTSRSRSVSLVNAYRRRGIAWVDRISYRMTASGPEIAVPAAEQEVTELRVDPTKGFSGATGAVADLLLGNLLYTPVSTDRVSLPLAPDDAYSTTYRVTLLGSLGFDKGAYPSLSEARRQRRPWLAVQGLALEMVVPLFVNVALPAWGDQVKAWFSRAPVSVTDAQFADIVNAVASLWPSIESDLEEGDVGAAYESVIVYVAGSSTLTRAVLDSVQAFASEAFQDVGEEAMRDGVLDATEFVKRLFGAVNTIGTAADIVAQLFDIVNSDVANTWEITVLETQVTLTPSVATVRPNAFEEVAFEAGVREGLPEGARYRFRLENGLGTIDDGFSTGTEIVGTALNEVVFRPNDDAEGEEVLRVAVVRQVEGGDWVAVAEDQARIEVVRSRPRLIPEKASVEPGGSVAIDMRMQPAWEGGPLFTTWSLTSDEGDYQAGLEPLPMGTATGIVYEAYDNGDGVDTVAVDVYTEVDGHQLHVGSAEGEIRVEEEPTIVFGSYFAYQTTISDGERHATYATVQIPEVEGATKYCLRGYGGYDPNAFGSRDIRKVSPFGHDYAEEAPDGTMWQALSAVFGPVENAPDAVASMDRRFASGWIWEVTVHRTEGATCGS